MSRSIFSKVPIAKHKKSVLDMSYNNAFTSYFGQLIPCYFEDCLPSDVVKLSAAPFVRMTPLTSPILGKLNVTMHYFFVPYRIIWDEWEDFITGGADGTNSPVMPYSEAVSFTGQRVNSLLDYLGLARTNLESGGSFSYSSPKVNQLAWRSYWKIIDDYFRDQNLTPSFFDEKQQYYISTGSGRIDDLPGYNYEMNGYSLFRPFPHAWRKDLFTSALPFAQRGAPVTIPISTVGELQYSNDGVTPVSANVTLDGNDYWQIQSPQATTLTGKGVVSGINNTFNINDLREASAIQRFLEMNAIGGSRYTEQVRAHFGEMVPDYRLDRPEFLAGLNTPVLTSQVLQTSQTNTDSVLGTQGGHGIAAGVMKPFTYKCREHGCIIGLMSIVPDAYYSQGVKRCFQKFDKLDYFFPYFENLGEQEIYNSEIYAQGNANDTKAFGYGPRYYEYKHRENEVHGLFRDQLAYWIPQRIFSSLPALNQDFVSVDPSKENSLNNIFPVTASGQDQFYCVVTNSVRMIRPVSKYSKFKLV